ncbi:hypothetical protein JCGZ_00676 [Jatropha curcas]|uniref:F-box associated domain-containing protein n=1 Tax=Jatropha curcas TaxID=180498 RepID=A0A067L491_JATCU|nr:hypothetical protein JCGZ_00676 [Jatropha curcas]
MLPECLVNSSALDVASFGESSIAVIRQLYDKKSDIWVMKKYGEVASWLMLGTMGKCWRGKSRVLGFRSEGDVFLHFHRGGIASRNVESQRKIISNRIEIYSLNVMPWKNIADITSKHGAYDHVVPALVNGELHLNLTD